jgi:thymidylate synthase (FAD)
MASDLDVVAAARVSNDVEYEEASKGPEADKRLINYLVKHRHGTPFEHTAFKFFVKTPLFVVREWQRHRMASYNEASGRYIEFLPEFYIPDTIRVPAATNKQGSVEPEAGFDHWSSRQDIIDSCMASYAYYQRLLKAGVAKEMARIVLPLNTYTKFYYTVNARSLMNFLNLRNASDAQWEIRQYAIAMESDFNNIMPITYECWINNDRITP